MVTPSKSLKQSADERAQMAKLIPVFVIVLVDLLGLTIIVPLLPLYSASFGANAFMVGLLGASYPIMQVIGAPLLGRLSDRYGRKPILIISQIGTLIGFVLMGLANALPMLFLARIIDGLSGGNIATAQAVIADNTDEKSRTAGLAMIGAAFGIGFTIGPVIAFAALAISGNNYQVPAFVAAGCSFISILLSVFWLQESLPITRRGQTAREQTTLRTFAAALRMPTIGFLLLLMFGQQFVFGGMEQLLSLFTLNRLGFDGRSNAILFVFIGLITVVMLGSVIRVWSRKHTDRWIILVGLTTLSIGMILTAVTPMVPPPWYSQATLLRELGATASNSINVTVPPDSNTGLLGLVWIMLAMIPASIGGSVLSPTINSAITKRVDSAQIGGILGVSAALVSVANALAPIILGALYQICGSTAPFLIGGGVLAILLFFVLKEVRDVTQQPHVQPQTQL